MRLEHTVGCEKGSAVIARVGRVFAPVDDQHSALNFGQFCVVSRV
jgi:hypothetical protein